MAYGAKPLRRVQISNPENTVGTAEAATAILLLQDVTQISQGSIFHRPQHDRGNLAKFYEDPFQVSQYAELEMSGDLYDQIMVYIASNSIRGNVTPTQPDNVNEPNHYLWTFEPGLTTGS